MLAFNNEESKTLSLLSLHVLVDNFFPPGPVILLSLGLPCTLLLKLGNFDFSLLVTEFDVSDSCLYYCVLPLMLVLCYVIVKFCLREACT